MTNSEAWAQHETYTKGVTEQSRKLGYALAATCWFFKTEDATFPPLILGALCLILLFFAVDMLQYVVGARKWAAFARGAEKTRWESKSNWDEPDANDGVVELPDDLDAWPNGLWITKLVLLAAGAALLMSEFLVRLDATV